MRRYKKKPVVIEATQLTKDNIIAMYEWVHNVDFSTVVGVAYSEIIDNVKANGGLVIHTLEGEMLARFGDYIIKGIKGEFYPCKPDVFLATYEEVE